MPMTTFSVRQLEEARRRLDEVIARLDTETRRIRTDIKLTAQGRYEALADLRKRTEPQLAAIMESARAAEAAADRGASKAFRPPADVSERLLQESQEQRAWDRARALLEAGSDVSELIARAGQSGDVATLRALRAEMPAWREARAGTSAGDLRGPLARRDARENAELLLEDIDRAEAAHLPLEQRRVVEAKFQAKALAEAVRSQHLLATRSQHLLATDIVTGNQSPRSWIRAGLATDMASAG